MESKTIAEEVAIKQNYKCANKPGSKLKRLEDYICPLWKKQGGLLNNNYYMVADIDSLKVLCEKCYERSNRKTSKYDDKMYKMYDMFNDGIDHLDADDILEILKAENDHIELAIKLVNFGKYPEHHNVYLNDLNATHGHSYGEEGWEIIHTEVILYRLKTSKRRDLKKLVDKLRDGIPDKYLDRIMTSIEVDNKKQDNRIKEMLYENRNIAIKTRDSNDTYSERQMLIIEQWFIDNESDELNEQENSDKESE